MAASYALLSLIRTIELEFLQPDTRISLDDEDKDALIALLDKLTFFKAYLTVTWESSGGFLTAAIRDSEIKIRDFALETEDSIEMQLSNILLQGNNNETEHRQELRRLLKQAAEDAGELFYFIIINIMNDPDYEPESLVPIFIGSSQRTPPNSVEKMIGGYNRSSVGLIKDMMLERRQEHQVIPIFGMPGIGKTCLVANVYEDPLVDSLFDVKAWVTVSHDYDEQRALSDLLSSMFKTEEGDTLSQLKDRIFEQLKDKRYLIVLDDVWTTQDYDAIQECFPKDPCGSCILVTTVFHEVCRHILTSKYFCMSLLYAEESWDLFCSRLSLEKSMPPKFEEIAKRIVHQCQGLPRSIVAVAKRLSECDYALKEWKKIEKEVEALGALYRDVEYSSKLSLIYNQLPQQGRVCFLYFAIFPKYTKIDVINLVKLWVAEGFVELDDVGYSCLEALYDCSLVLSGNDDEVISIVSCRMHSAIHSFCTREALKEGLFCAVNTQQCSGRWSLDALENSCRWLSLRSHSLDYYVLFSSNNPRSFLFFNGNPEMFVPFRLLRVLVLSRSPKIPKTLSLRLEGLVFLRYLYVPHWFEGLDYVVSRNKNLQTLVVYCDESKFGASPLHLPSRIWEPTQLRHLELGNLFTVDPPSMIKKHMHTLSWASPTRFGRNLYCKFPNLRQLKVFYTEDVSDESIRSKPIVILEEMEYLYNLENLTVVAPVGSMTLLERNVFPKNLRELSLVETNLPVKVLGLIGQIPNLKILSLENAFYGRVWKVSEGFLNLASLKLEARNLEQWVADATHFPWLRRLEVRRCYCLGELPSGFVEMPTFWSLKIQQCPASVVNSAERIRKEAMDRHKTFDLIVDCFYYWK